MITSWTEHQAQIASLRKRVEDESLNLQWIQELWFALGSGKHDLRSGVELVRIFRPSILTNSKSAVVFAHAYEDLGLRSGELPRGELFDSALVRALQDVRTTTRDESLDWVCSFLPNAE
jgi:hypothetical protein